MKDWRLTGACLIWHRFFFFILFFKITFIYTFIAADENVLKLNVSVHMDGAFLLLSYNWRVKVLTWSNHSFAAAVFILCPTQVHFF